MTIMTVAFVYLIIFGISWATTPYNEKDLVVHKVTKLEIVRDVILAVFGSNDDL